MASQVLISAIILAISEPTLNSMYSDIVSSFVSSTVGYTFPDRLYDISQGPMTNPLYLMVRSLTFTSFTISSYDITLITPDVIDVSISNITASLNFKWEYSIGAMSDNGMASLTINSMSVDSEINVENSLLLQFSAGNINAKIQDLAISVTDSGNKNSNWVFRMFKQDISDLICNTVQTTIKNFLNSANFSPMYSSINNGIGFNYSLAVAPIVTSEIFQLNSIGMFVQDSNPNYKPPIPVPSQASINQTSGVQVVLTDYTLNSLSYSAFEAELLSFNVSNDNLPKNFPVPLSTTILGIAIPGLVDQYGLGQDVSLACNFKSPPEIHLQNEPTWNAEIGAEGYLVCSLLVNNDQAFVVGMDLAVDSTIFLQNWAVKGKINELKVVNLDVISDKVNINTSSLKTTINTALLSYVSSINNDYLTNGVQLQSYEHFDLTSTQIRTGNGFLYILTNPKISFTISDLYNYIG